MPSDPVDPVWLERTARAQRYRLDSFERAYRLADLLARLNADAWLGPRLALKGGTCINFFHADLARLSVDMDLNYIGSVDRTRTIEERPRVIETTQRIAAAAGYDVRDVRNPSYVNRKIRFLYTNVHGAPDAIRADIGFLWRHPIYPVQSYDLPDVFEVPGSVACLSPEEVYGGKMAALASRALPRDLYDGFVFYQRAIPHDPDRLRRAFTFHALMQDASLRHVAPQHLDAITDRDVRDSLWPLLASTDRPGRADMLNIVRPQLEHLCRMPPDAVRFQNALLEGNYDPSLLFANEDVSAELVRHPAALRRAKYPRPTPRS